MMNRQYMKAFVAVSLLLHAALLLIWQPRLELPVAGQRLITVTVNSQQSVQRSSYADASNATRIPIAPSVPKRGVSSKALAQRQPEKTHQEKLAQTTTASAAAHTTRSEPALLARKNITVYLQKTVAANFHYPVLARRQGWQGKVRLAMHIEANGKLSSIRVQQSSGHGILDQAAMQTLQTIKHIPEAVSWLQGHALDIVLPVEYRLLDS